MKKIMTAIACFVLAAGVAVGATVSQTSSTSLTTKQPPRGGVQNSNFYDIVYNNVKDVCNTDIPALITEVNRQGTGVLTWASGCSIDSTSSNIIDATLATTATDNGNLRIIGGASANADGDDIGVLVRGTDTGGTAVTYCDINVDMTDADTGTEDATVTIAIPIAGSLTTELTIDSTGITSAGDVSGSTIGAITEANLLDKTATESISGVYTHTAKLIADPAATTTNTSIMDITYASGSDIATVFDFSSENIACVTNTAAILTNALSLIVQVNGTNYLVGLAALP